MAISIQEEKYYLSLAKKEGFDITKNKDKSYTIFTEDRTFPLCHPYQIHITLYRTSPCGSERKYQHMKAAHDYLWPNLIPTWHKWTEQRFHAHCSGFNQIVLAGGAACAKSFDTARIASLFWLSNPLHNACIVASTTLESLESRIWGYVMKLMNTTAIPIAAKLLRAKPPKIVHPQSVDKIHGMFAVAIHRGDDDSTLSTLIGRHPDKGMMMVLDEATDMEPAIIKAFPNLEKGVEFFQLIAIGNSNSKNDLHGSLATPKNGWKNIDPERDEIWETTHKNSVCLYSNPTKSPAISELDPLKKLTLAKFLMTEPLLEEEKLRYGEHSDAYWRFVMGFWKSQSLDDTLTSEMFLSEYEVWKNADWSGFTPLLTVAGLDPAFQVGGIGCVLRFAILGQTTSGLMVLDYRNEELLHRIDISINSQKSGELQIAESVCHYLRKYNCELNALAIDVTGPGRVLGELIKQIHGSSDSPIKITCAGNIAGFSAKKNSDIYVTMPSELWLKFREFIQHSQIKGLDLTSISQLTSRRITVGKNKKLLLESKSDYQARMTAINPKLARSPDEADAAILALHSAILTYGFTPGQFRTPPPTPDLWHEKLAAISHPQPITPTSRFALVPNFEAALEETQAPYTPHPESYRYRQ